MSTKVLELVEDVPAIARQWHEVVERWGTGGLPDETPYARLHGATFKEFNKRVVATLELVAAWGRVDEAGQVLLLPKVASVAKQLKAASAAIQQLIAEMNTHPQVEFRDATSSLDAVQGFIDGGPVSNVSAGPLLDQVSAAMSTLFDLTAPGLRVGTSKGLSLYLECVEQLQDLTGDGRKLRDELLAMRDGARVNLAQTNESAAQSATHAVSAGEASDKSSECLIAAKEALSEAEAKLAAIRETAKAAASLQTQVEGYEASFDAFQKSLDERVAQHVAFEKNMAEALAANKGRESEIDRLIAKSESMIVGATTAGLGDSLEKTRKLYQSRMFGAGLGFFASVLLLAASAIPLVAHILPGLFVAWLPISVPSTTQTVAVPLGGGDALLGLLGKIFLMFPATWLTQFFSKAYSEFFHLEREYAHKAALAQSVEGFKKQAPKYQEEIATAVFFEVQSNPSKQKAPDAAEHPILGPLMKKFIDALPLGKPPS